MFPCGHPLLRRTQDQDHANPSRAGNSYAPSVVYTYKPSDPRPSLFPQSPPLRATSEDLSEDPSLRLEQKLLLRVISSELHQHTFEDNHFLANLLPIPPAVDIDKVKANMRTSHANLSYIDEKGKRCAWKHKRENDAYQALAWFFDEIISAFSSSHPDVAHGLKEDPDTFFQQPLSFDVWDKPVQEKDQPNHKKWLKPDLIGKPFAVIISWESLSIVVEVKDDWKEMLVQSGSYARCLLAYHEAWASSFILSFHHKRRELRVCNFNHSGLVHSQSMVLTTSQGFTDAVKAIVGLACLDRTRAGVDVSRYKNLYKLPGNLGHYELVETEVRRKRALVGRVSRVNRVRKVVIDNCTRPICQDGVEGLDIEPPPSLIIKDSWRVVSELAAREGSMFDGISRFFGVPEVLAAYQLKDLHGALLTTRRFVSNGAKKSTIFEKPSTILRATSFVERVRYREIIRTEGKDLREADNIQMLLRATLHAMLGLYNVYLNGWIHRDVNIGNIMLLVTPEVRCTNNLECLSPERRQLLGECTGMLIDEDQGIKEETVFDTTKQASGSRTGNLQFLSARLLQSRVLPTPTISTAIDDLESFIWVLCYAVLEICPRHRELNSSEEMLLQFLCRKGNVVMMAEDKKGYANHLHALAEPIGPSFSSITPLVEKWCALATTYSEKVTCLFADIPPSPVFSHWARNCLHELSLEAFGKYLEEGFIMLDQLEDRCIPW